MQRDIKLIFCVNIKPVSRIQISDLILELTNVTVKEFAAKERDFERKLLQVRSYNNITKFC